MNLEEKKEFLQSYRRLLTIAHEQLTPKDVEILKQLFDKAVQLPTPSEMIHPMIRVVNTTLILIEEMGLGRVSILSVALYESIKHGIITIEDVEKNYEPAVNTIISGLIKANELYKKNYSIETENFRKLLLTLVEDVRVILIMIADRVFTMRHLEVYPTETQLSVAREVSFLYAPLSHRLGLYRIKSELEDLSLKFTNREIYKEIAQKLNETKRSRDAYIKSFIEPLKVKMAEAGLKCSIKGRTKSIASILNKIRKQNTTFENIYDLFAIRIILDSPLEREKMECWQVYSIITDMYQPNPKRLRDWLSVPKSNGYESLHITVIGPESKWVEVQIRTERMDEIAEKGLAAHWKYKGIKSENGLDEYLNSIREILENPELNAVDFIDDFKLNLYNKEVFVFTPKGDLRKLPKGSTVLDFAFDIHTKVGCSCVGAKINNKNYSIRHELSNGDQVEILTSTTQRPKNDWLKIVQTSKAKTRIKQAIKEIEIKEAEEGKEMVKRRFKNWKIDFEEATISRVMKKMSYKTLTDLYRDVATEKLDIQRLRKEYEELELHENLPSSTISQSASGYVKTTDDSSSYSDELVIDKDLKGIDYKLSKCCNPIYGDEIFGLVSALGGLKIHRVDCPNAPQMIAKLAHRIVKARWSGKAVTTYPITLMVVGADDIGIVTNITSVISKESQISLRNISIDSSDGIFRGQITIMVSDVNKLQLLMKKIQAVHGVKSVERA